MKGLPARRRRRSALRSGAAAVTGPLLAACASERAAGTAPTQHQASMPAAPVTLDLAWEATTNEVGALVQGQAKQLFEQRHPGVTLNIVDGKETAAGRQAAPEVPTG